MVKDYHESSRALQGVPYTCNFWHGFWIRARIFFRQKTKNFRLSISFTSISINKNGKDSKNRCFFRNWLVFTTIFLKNDQLSIFITTVAIRFYMQFMMFFQITFGYRPEKNFWVPMSTGKIFTYADPWWSFDYYYMTWYLWVENLDGNAEEYIHREVFPKCEGTLKCALNKFY